MSKYASKEFWVDAGDRALVSFAQALLATGVFESSGLIGIDWGGILSLAGGYALTSLLTSVVFRGRDEGKIKHVEGDAAPTGGDPYDEDDFVFEEEYGPKHGA